MVTRNRLALTLTFVMLVWAPAQSQQALMSDLEIRQLLVGKKALLANGSMEFSTDGKVVTQTNAGRVFRGTYTISNGSLCRDYGADGGRKCYRVAQEGREFAIVDNANVRLRFSVPGVAPAADPAASPSQAPGTASAAPPAAPLDPVASDPAKARAEIARVVLGELNKGEVRSTFKLDGLAMVSSYAIQDWSDENAGGQMVLEHDPQRGWRQIGGGGGALAASDLVALGIPRPVAERLMASVKANWAVAAAARSAGTTSSAIQSRVSPARA